MRLLSNWQRNEKARQKPDTQSGSGFNGFPKEVSHPQGM
ncbi:hypothetical protein B4098_1096 [Heyndrickxia coagulans]|uniref:Uncharacterized protein n=1 Tax=Heyndrickxia coagulans TaxID=1398 RepID=A0A150JT32_HEYCO|nr:hypothetical protein B4098_1096 [Heyndrickxia coagulans]